MNPRILGSDAVRTSLTYEACIPLVRKAMEDLSSGRSLYLLRSFIRLGENRVFGVMPGALAIDDYFGAKLVSVFDDPAQPGRRLHQGVVVLFEGATGKLLALVDAEAITLIRTAAASAVATDALASRNASRLAVLGTGHQAEAHIRAIQHVRALTDIFLWGRSAQRASDVAARLAGECPRIRVARTAQDAVANADIVCTVTSAATPILQGEWVRPGTHVNVVGSSTPGPVEVDSDLVVRSTFIADHREHVLRHGAEFLQARNAGLIQDEHVVAEIGEVLCGTRVGRTDDAQITVYKSLGHIVQDLAAAAFVYEQHRDRLTRNL
jgi:ornithine cyclodeaminase/alanine dehydrogenase-like protein (mu-crystallin family)